MVYCILLMGVICLVQHNIVLLPNWWRWTSLLIILMNQVMKFWSCCDFKCSTTGERKETAFLCLVICCTCMHNYKLSRYYGNFYFLHLPSLTSSPFRWQRDFFSLFVPVEDKHNPVPSLLLIGKLLRELSVVRLSASWEILEIFNLAKGMSCRSTKRCSGLVLELAVVLQSKYTNMKTSDWINLKTNGDSCDFQLLQLPAKYSANFFFRPGNRLIFRTANFVSFLTTQLLIHRRGSVSKSFFSCETAIIIYALYIGNGQTSVRSSLGKNQKQKHTRAHAHT